MVEIVCGGFVINGAYPVSFRSQPVFARMSAVLLLLFCCLFMSCLAIDLTYPNTTTEDGACCQEKVIGQQTLQLLKTQPAPASWSVVLTLAPTRARTPAIAPAASTVSPCLEEPGLWPSISCL